MAGISSKSIYDSALSDYFFLIFGSGADQVSLSDLGGFTND